MWIILTIGCMPLRFEVEGTTAVMTGDLRGNAVQKVERLLENHPDLEWIEILDCPGSMDDDATLAAGRLIREEGINTRVPSNGEIYSGGVDFFIAGAVREYQDGGIVGVHSWSDGRTDGSELDADDPEHDMYVKYYGDMGISDQFYWFTLEAASSDDIHEMTHEEMIAYGLISE